MSVATVSQLPNYSQQPRKSRIWLWVVLGSVIGVLLFTALVAGSVFFALHSFFQQTDESVPVVASYALAFMRQDYESAYSHLDSQATIKGQQVDQQSFTALATMSDIRYGKVSGYSIDSLSQENDSSNVTITVHRGDRKIINADGV